MRSGLITKVFEKLNITGYDSRTLERVYPKVRDNVKFIWTLKSFDKRTIYGSAIPVSKLIKKDTALCYKVAVITPSNIHTFEERYNISISSYVERIIIIKEKE